MAEPLTASPAKCLRAPHRARRGGLWRWRRVLGGLGFLLALAAAPARGQAVAPAPAAAELPSAGAERPAVSAPLRLDSPSTRSLSQGMRIAALGPGRLAVGWTVGDGSAMGVYLRLRNHYLWDPARTVSGDSNDPAEALRTGAFQPRDLDLALEAPDQLHLTWTALAANGARLPFYAYVDASGRPRVIPLAAAAPTTDTAAAESDFPTVAATGDGGALVVWQESQALRYTIHAARVAADGAVSDLGTVSGLSTSGMAPRILAVRPALTVAWYEITDTGSAPRVSEWAADEARWRPAAAERQTQGFPDNVQLLLDQTPQGLVACWQDLLASGLGAIRVGLAGAPQAVQTLAEPPGDHAQPSLSGSLPGRLTLSWQVFSKGQQLVRLASLAQEGRSAAVVTISPPAQRFAAQPDHVTVADWSAVVWTDSLRDGGQGGVYFSEINWSAGQ